MLHAERKERFPTPGPVAKMTVYLDGRSMADSVSTLLTREAALSDSLLRATRATVATRDPQRILQELIALDLRLRTWAKESLSDSVALGAAQMLVAILRGSSHDVLLAVRRCRLRARCSLLRTFAFLSKERLQLAEEAAVLLGSHVRQLIQRHAYLRQRLSVSRSKADAENMLVAGHRIAPKHPHQSHDAHKARVLGSFRSDQAALLAVEQRLRSVGALQLGAAFKAPLATLPGSSFQTALDYNRIVRDSAAVGQLDALTRAARCAADHLAELEGLCTVQASALEMPPLRDLPAWQVGERRRRAAVRAKGIVRTAHMVFLEKERTAFEDRARVLEALLSTQSTLRKLASAGQISDSGGVAAEPPTPTPVPLAAPASAPGSKEAEQAEAADEWEEVPATSLTARRHRSRLDLTSPEGTVSRLSAPAWSAPLHSLLLDLELLEQEGAFGGPTELEAAPAEPGAAVSSVSPASPASPAPVSPVLGLPASDLLDLSDLSELSRGGSPGGRSPGPGVAVAMAPLLQALAHSLSSLRLVTAEGAPAMAATSQPPPWCVRPPTHAPTQRPTHPHPPLRLAAAAAPPAAPHRGEARHPELGPPLWRPPPAVASAAPAVPPAGPLPAGPLPARPKPLARAMSSQLVGESQAPAWIPSGRPSGLLRPTSAKVLRAPRVFETRTRGETIRPAPSLCRDGKMAGGVPERTTERLARVESVLLPLETPNARRVQVARRAPCWVE